MTRASWYVVVGLAFAVHNGEEALAAGTLLDVMQHRGPVFLRGLYAGVTVRELQVNLVVLSVAGLIVSAIARRSIERRGAAFAMTVFAAVLGLNALAHIAMTVAMRTYVPGLVTAAMITLPVAVLLLSQARREQWVSGSAFWAVVPAALLVHGPLLVAFIRISLGVMRAMRTD